MENLAESLTDRAN